MIGSILSASGAGSDIIFENLQRNSQLSVAQAKQQKKTKSSVHPPPQDFEATSQGDMKRPIDVHASNKAPPIKQGYIVDFIEPRIRNRSKVMRDFGTVCFRGTVCFHSPLRVVIA